MSERRVTIKKESDLPDVGTKVSLQVIDGKVEAVIIGEGSNSIRVTKSGSYSEDLKITTLDQGEKVDKWFITGKLLGLSDYEEGPFDEQYQANEAIVNLIDSKGLPSDHGLEIESRTVVEYSDKI